MGECMHWLRAEFPDAVTDDLQAQVEGFVQEGVAAERFWGASRFDQKVSPFAFWTEFRDRFPQVYQYLGDFAGCDEWERQLAGQMSFSECATLASEPEPVLVYRAGVELFIEGNVWHLARWDGLASYLITHFGAQRAVWGN